MTRISDFPEYWAKHKPESEALVLGANKISYAQLSQAVDRCALALIAAGIGKGDRVAVLCTPRPEALVIFLAAIRIGAVWVGLNTKYTVTELSYIVNDCKPKILFFIPEHKGRQYVPDIKSLLKSCQSIRSGVLLGNESDNEFLSFPGFLEYANGSDPAQLTTYIDNVQKSDPALLVYTSGTTGQPKGALLPHHGLVYCSRIQGQHYPADPLRILNNLPINHVGCIGDIYCYCLVAGGTCVLMESFEPAAIGKVIEQNKITVWGQVPTMFQLTLDHPDFSRHDISSLQRIFWSGAMASAELIDKLRDICPNIGSCYGMTETVGSVVYSDDHDDTAVLARSIGRPDPRFEVRIAGSDGQPGQPGEPGEIQVKGDFLMLGYLNAADKTRAAFTEDRWLKTGDLAVEEADGHYRLIGRTTDMFKSGGYNVYPREIELVLESHPAITMAAVVPVDDPVYQEIGHAFVQLEKGESLDGTNIRQYCKKRLANYKVPKAIHIVAEFPMLPIGKIDKVALAKGKPVTMKTLQNKPDRTASGN